MVHQLRRPPAAFQRSLVFTLLLLVATAWCFHPAAAQRQTTSVPHTPATDPSHTSERRQARFAPAEPTAPATAAAAFERALEQACALPRHELAWQAWGLVKAAPRGDLCETAPEERGRARANWLAALGLGASTDLQAQHLLNATVVLEDGGPVWWASGGAAGLWRGTAAGWQQISTESTDFAAVPPQAPQTLYAVRGGWRLERSLDGGANFTLLTPQLAEPNDAERLTTAPLLIHPHEAAQLWTGGRSLWRSLDGGARWSVLSDPVAGSEHNRVSVLALVPASGGEPERLLVGTREGWLQRFTLNAENVHSNEAVLPRRGFVSALAVAPHDPRVLYAAYASLGGPHVWQSKDGGVTWRALDGAGVTALPDLPVNALAADDTGRLFVGTDAGVFVASAAGLSWARVWTGPWVTALHILPKAVGEAQLYAFANTQQGAGVWRAPLAEPSEPTQATQSICVQFLTPRGLVVPAAGGTQTIEVQAAANCAWTVQLEPSAAGWTSVEGSASGQGNARVTLSFLSNAAYTPRFGTVTIGGFSVALAQTGALNHCQTLPLRPGETVTGQVTLDDCFLYLGSQNFHYADQYRFEGRAGELIAVLAQSLTSGTGVSFSVTGPNGLGIAVREKQLNEQSLAALPQTGSYTLQVYGSHPQQTLTYRLALQLLTPGCHDLEVMALDRVFSAAGGSGRLNVSTASNCAWQVFTSAPWLTLTQSTGSGSTQLAFTVAENLGTTPRTGYLQIGTRQAVITQAGRFGDCGPQPLTPNEPINGELTPGDCPFSSVNSTPTDRYVFRGRAGERLSAELTTTFQRTIVLGLHNARGAELAWGYERIPSAVHQPFVPPLTLAEDGLYTLTVSSHVAVPYTLLVRVQPADCIYTVTPDYLNIPSGGGPTTLQLQTGAHCPWFLQRLPNSEWLPLAAESSGVGPRTLTLNVPANRGPQPRGAALAWGEQLIQLSQTNLPNTCAVVPITPGQPVRGALAPGDCLAQSSQVLADRFSFHGTAGQVFSFTPTTISNHPSAPPTLIAGARYGLLDPQGKLIAAGQTDLSVPLPSFILPSTGTYLFELASTTQWQYYDYELTIHLSAVACNSYATVSATRFEMTGGNGSVQIEAPPGCPWRVLVQSAPRHFSLLDPAAGTGRGQVRFTFGHNLLGRAEPVWLWVGQQSLFLAQAGQSGTCQARPLPFEQFVSGQLTIADCPLVSNWSHYSENNRPGHRYTFAGRAGEQIALSALRVTAPKLGAPLTPTVSLYDPDGRLLNDSSTARALSGQYLLSQTGTYTVEVVSPANTGNAGTSWNYQLLLERLSAGCLYMANTGLQRFSSMGGSGSFSLTTGSPCQWTPRVNAPWVRLTQPAANVSTSGSANVSFTVSANTAAEARTATIVAGGQLIELEQAGWEGTCAVLPLPPNRTVTGALEASDCRARVGTGVADLYELTTETNERWRLAITGFSQFNFVLFDPAWRIVWQREGANTAPYWVTLPPGTYYLQVALQAALAPLPAAYTLVREVEAGTCNYTVLSNQAHFFGAGGSGTLTVLTGPGCPWTASVSTPPGSGNWLTLNQSGGSGPGTVTYQAQPYELLSSGRTGWIVVAQQSFTIIQSAGQAPGQCETPPLALGQTVSGTLGPNDCLAQFLPPESAARADRFRLTGPANELFAVEVTSAAPVRLTLFDAQGRSIAQADGNRLPALHLFPSYLLMPEQQTYFLEVAATSANQLFNYTVRLAAPDSCTYALVQTAPPLDQPLPASGGTVTLQVISAPGCAWDARPSTAGLPWLSFNGPAAGTGPGPLSFTLAPNPTENFRIASVRVSPAGPVQNVGQLGQGGSCQTHELAPGATVRGTLKAADCARPPHYSGPIAEPHRLWPTHRFTFNATAGTQLAVLQRAGLNSNLGQFTLYDPQGQLIGRAQVPAIPYNPTYPPVTRLTLVLSGAYTLEYSGPLGPYEFTLDLTPGECGYVLESVQAQIASTGGSGTATVRTQSHCAWTAYATEPWLTLSQNSGTGNGTLHFSVAPNQESTEAQTRVGFIRLGGRSLPIVQAGFGGSCAPVPINAGQSLAGEITRRDCLRLGPNQQTLAQPVDRYSFTARAGEQAQVKVVSNGSLGVQIVPLSALALSSAAGLNTQPGQPVDWFGTASLTIPTDGTYVIEVMPSLGNLQQLPYTIHLEVNAPGCGIALAETEVQFGAAASQGSLDVTSAPGCRWQVYAVQDWITVNGARERTGAETVHYTLSANPGAAARWGVLLVGGQILVIEQAGVGSAGSSAGSCVTGTIAAGQTVYGNLSAADCRPRANVPPNLPTLLVADRYSFRGLAGERVQLIARLAEPPVPLPPSTPPLLPTLTLFDAHGTLLAQFNAATSPLPLHARVPQSGDFFSLPSTGEYLIEVALRNLPRAPLQNDYALSLVSAPPTCSYTVEAGPLRFEAGGGSGTVTVVTSSACTWTATLSEPWLSSDAMQQTGNGTVTFTVAPNATNRARRGLLLVGGRICVIEQAGSAGQCHARPLTPGLALSGQLDEQDCHLLPPPQEDRPTTLPLLYAERFSFMAQANDRLRFTLTAHEGATNAPASVQVRLLNPQGLPLLSSNNDRTVLPQSGIYEIEISSSQAVNYTALLLLAPNACQFSLNPRRLQFEAAGGASSLPVNTAGSCAWQAVSNAAWLSVENQAGGTGNGTLNLRAAANPNASARTTLVIIGDQTVTVEQAGSAGRCVPRPLVRNQIIHGRWDNEDCGAQIPQPNSYTTRIQYQDHYSFAAQAGERLSLTLQTPVQSPQIELYDEQGRLIAIVNGKRLPSGAGEFLLPSAGLYTVRVVASEAAAYSLLATDSRSCSVTVTPNPLLTGGAGGKRELFITASQPGCAWSARPANNWITLPHTPPAWQPEAQLFNGSRLLEITLAPNLGAPRTGYLWLADQLISVQQDTRQLIPVAEPLVCVNAATFVPGALAPELLVSAFGARLATETRAATGWTYNLADTTVTITDQAQLKREAYVLFVSPTQVNFVMPTGLAPGPVTVAITSADGYVTSCTLPLAIVAPGLFSANASGSGWASGLALRVKSDGSQTYEPLTWFDPTLNRLTALPLTVNGADETVYLVLFGTGLRGRAELGAVSARIGTTSLPVSYCGPVQNLLGLDQVNLALPASLAGSGSVSVELIVEGRTANLVRIQVR
jgi:uncharacterized protein (TIGR03437 family)